MNGKRDERGKESRKGFGGGKKEGEGRKMWMHVNYEKVMKGVIK